MPGRGVQVPGCPQDFLVDRSSFADDLAMASAMLAGIARQNQALDRSLAKHEMHLNVKKCGIILFTPDAAARAHWREQAAAHCETGEAPALPDPGPAPTSALRSRGKQIPVVSEYKYLGLLLDLELSYERMCEGRLLKAQKCFNGLLPFLRSKRVTLYLRLLPVKMVLLPCLLYGTEVFGGSQSRFGDAQRLINRALRLCLDAGGSDGLCGAGLPLNAVYCELRVPPIHCLALARRCRLYSKAFQLRTNIKTLVAHTRGVGTTGQKWSTTSKPFCSHFGFVNPAIRNIRVPLLSDLISTESQSPSGMAGPRAAITVAALEFT